MIKYKEGVDYRGLNPVMRKALIEAEKVYTKYGATLVVTSGLDGNHKNLSWHYFGSAVDLRTLMFSLDEIQKIAQEIQQALGKPYEVVVEKTHIHLEYDWNKL